MELRHADRPAGRSDVEAVADSLAVITRAWHKARARMLADTERSTFLLLRCVALHGGPVRATDLAEALHSDPSTVSRQVTRSVNEGYLERQADPADGRASLLALTGKGRDLLAAQDRARIEYYEHVLADWTREDLRAFSGLLQRFTHDYTTNADRHAEHLAAGRHGGGNPH